MKTATVLRACSALVAGMLVNEICLSQSAADSMVGCTYVAEKSARLRCYDDQMMRLGHKIESESAAASMQVPAETHAPAPPRAAAAPSAEPSSPAQAPAPVSKQTEFALTPEMRKKRLAETATKSSQELVARVTAVSARAHGEHRIELDNGQVWVETQSTTRFDPPAVGDTVTVRHGTLGSYFLSAQSGPARRVERIR
jgi:hypothetical protein